MHVILMISQNVLQDPARKVALEMMNKLNASTLLNQ